MKNASTPITSIIASLILFAAVPAVFAWTGPTAVPPAGNTAAPVNVSTTSQNKTGVLGLGGLAVFGKSLFTEASGYELPKATKPSMLVGVNGAIGAKEYCDQNGNNCVATLAGGVTATGSGSSGSSVSSGGIIKGSEKNLGSGWNVIEMTGAYISQDAAPTGGYIYKSGGAVRASIVEASGITMDVSLTSTYQCAHTFCVKLSGGDVFVKPGQNAVAYIIWN